MLFSQEIKFDAENIDVKENGNLMIGYNSNTNIPGENININSEKAEYNKNKGLLIFTENVIIKMK